MYSKNKEHTPPSSNEIPAIELMAAPVSHWAHQIGRSSQWLYKQIRENKVRAFRPGGNTTVMILKEDFIEFLTSHAANDSTATFGGGVNRSASQNRN